MQLCLLHIMEFDNLKQYQRYFTKLVKWEREQEITTQVREIKHLTGLEREKKGRAILFMSGKQAGIGLGGTYLVRFKRVDKLPDTQIGVGDLVIASDGTPSGDEPQAVVTEKTVGSLTIAYKNEPPDYVYRKNVRIDLFANDITFQRMFTALGALKNHNRLAEFLLGHQIPLLSDLEQKSPEYDRLNHSQQYVVTQTLRANDIFLIHGPPGTGKTTTLTAVIDAHVRRGLKILATADSNTAVDNMVEKIAERGLRVVRMGNPARINENLASKVLDYLIQDEPDYQESMSLWNEVHGLKEYQRDLVLPSGKARRGLSDDKILKLAKKGAGSHGITPRKIKKMARWLELQQQVNNLIGKALNLEKKAVKKVIMDADVVCTTNASAGSEVLQPFDFDVVVVDEATQSTEPSCLIPMVKGKKWIMAGDHRQLPPTVMSREASALSHTLFERWIEHYEGNFSGMLTEQYRMHEKIMAFSAAKFYSGLLNAHPSVKDHRLDELAGFKINEYLPDWQKEIIDPGKPVVLLHVNGEEKQLQEAYSYFNKEEAKIAMDLTTALLGCRLFPQDIGIIAPYEQQVNNIWSAMHGSGVEAKTIDGFQGREKEVIIISFVRSNSHGNLGFLKDYRRLNVAITRARRKLVCIGNMELLKTDVIFKELINIHQTNYV